MFKIVIKVLALCSLVESISWNRGNNVGEFLTKKLEVVENATNMVSMQEIRLEKPIIIHHNITDPAPMKIFKSHHESVFVLKGNLLFTVKVDKQVQLTPLVALLLPAEAVQEMRVGEWAGMIIVVLRFQSNLHVYLTKNMQHSGPRLLEPVQKIKISSIADRIVLLKTDEELFLVTQIAKNNVAELSCYKWEASFFSRKTQDIVDFPSKSSLFGIDDVLNGPLVLSVGYGNSTQVIVFQLDPQAGRLTKLQSLHFKRNFAEHYVNNRRLFLIACSTESFCAVYKWNGGQFRRHFKISIQVLEKIAGMEYQQDFVILHNHDGSLQLFATDNIVHSEQGLVVKGAKEKSEYAICSETTSNPRSYFVEFTDKGSVLAVTSREISLLQILRESQNVTRDAKNCSRQLKSYLKQRIPQVQGSHQLALNLAQLEGSIQNKAIETINTKFTSFNNSHIKRISMPYSVGSTVMSVRDRITAAEISIARAHVAMKNSQKFSSMNRENDEALQSLKNIVVKNLQHESADNILNGIQLNTQSQLIFREKNKFRNTSAEKVVIEEGVINKIPVKHLLNSTSTQMLRGEKVLEHIELHKILSSLTVNNVNVSLLKSAINFWETFPNEFIFQGQVNVKNLHLTTLNGFDFNPFFQNVHLLNERSRLRGNCFIHNALSTNVLTIKQIMDLPVADLLTTSTDQAVAADCFVATFFTSMVNSQLVNNEKLNETIALVDSVNFVEVPTRMISAHISKNLNILDETVALPQTIENLRNHIIGTRTSDLAQIYSGIVKVEGTLRIKNIARLTPKTIIVLNNRRVPPQIKSSFWSVLGKQEILNQNFLVHAAQLSTGNIYSARLSQWPLSDYLSSSSNGSQGHLQVRFEEASVEGSVDGFKNNIPSLIFHSARECVPLKAPAMQLKSSVVFQDNQLTVRQLNAEHNRDSSWRSLVQEKNPNAHFKNRLHVRKIRTANFLVEKDLKTIKFNNLKLQSQLSAAINTSTSIDLPTLKIKTFGCGALSTKFFESHSFEVFMQNLMSQLQNSENNFIKSVSLVSTQFKKDAFSQTFNGKYNLGILIETLALKNDNALSCGGNLILANGVTVKQNLESKLINGFASSDFVKNSLSRFEKQTVASEFSCETMETKKLSVRSYNNVAMNQFVNKRETVMLSLKANLRTSEVSASNLDSKYSVLNVNKLKEALKFPECSTMQLVKASKGITAINNKSSYLERIVKFAVFKVGPPQIIAGKLHSGDTRAEIVSLVKPDALFYANTRFVSFYEIFGDSLKNGTKSLQKFSGITTLLSPAYCKNAVIKELAFYSSKEINNVVVDTLNKTIARPQTTIGSVKKFVKLRGKLMTLQNGPKFVHPTSFALTEIQIYNIETAFLKTYTIHQLSLNYFLENTLRLNSNAEQEVFWPVGAKSLTLLPDAVLSSINSVFVSDAVFSRNDQLQEIKGHKILNGKLTLQGPSTIKVINNIDHTDFLKNRILRSRDFSKRNLVISKANLPAGVSLESYVNGQKIELLLSDGSDVRRTQALLPSLEAMRNRENQESYTKRPNARRLLYIDNNKAIQFSRNDSRKANCLKNDVKVSPSKFNEVDISFGSDESMFDMTTLRIILSTPKALCKSDESRLEKENLSVEWFDRKNSETKFNTTIVLPGSLSDGDIVETQNGTVLMVATVMQKQESSISVYELDTNCNEWKITQPDIRFNRVLTSHVIDTWSHQFLAVSSTEEASPSEKYRITIFMLDQASNSFSQHQQWSWDVKADIMLSLIVQPTSLGGEPKIFLVLAEGHSRIVYIYQFTKSREFVFHQKINFESAITHIAVIDIADFSHFIVSLQSGQFCLYQFRGIESWKLKQCGQFPKVDVIRSYEYFKRQHVLLMSEKLNAATALSVYRQGDLI